MPVNIGGSLYRPHWSLAECARETVLQGLPAISLQFGPWGGAGMAAGDARLVRQLAAAGAPPLPPAEGLTALAAAVGAVHGGLPADQVRRASSQTDVQKVPY